MRQLFAYIYVAVKQFHTRTKCAQQADYLAELWQEFLSMLELIAKIFCAVVIARTSAVNGNRHCVAFLFMGFPRRFAPRNDIWGGCHNRNAV